MFFEKKPMKPKMFRKLFRLRGSLESCRVAYEKTTSVPIMGFEKNTVKEKNFPGVTKSAKNKNIGATALRVGPSTPEQRR